MDGARSNQGENDTDGYYYQLYTLLFCIDYLQQHKKRFAGFEIGSAITEYGALDDVVLHVTLPDNRTVTNLLQVKHSKNMIDQAYLCEKRKSYVFKYFQDFLKIKRIIPLEQLEDLIIWTNMSFAKNIENWFEAVVSTDTGRKDILGDAGELYYRRFRFRESQFKKVSQSFLEHAHPRTALVEKFIDVLFKKAEWSSKRVAKDYYRVMAKEIIECNGVNSKFKKGFITGEGLLPETVRFREYFERVMKEKFSEKRLSLFSMADLNSAEYGVYFQLKVDAEFVEGTNAAVQWKDWKDMPEESDLEDFRKRFVLYVKVPKQDHLKAFLIRKVGCVESWCELLEKCAFKTMINNTQIEEMFKLISLRRSMDCGPYMRLRFGDLDLLQQNVNEYLRSKKSGTYLHVKANQDVNCTVCRLVSTVENCLAPLSKRYLVLNYDDFKKNWNKLLSISEEKDLAENGLKCVIITSVPTMKIREIETKLTPACIKAIFVGDRLVNCFVDEFDISTLHPDCKEEISNRDIFLSNQHPAANARTILADELFRKENYQLALDLFKGPIQVEGNNLQLDEHFRPRSVTINRTKTDISHLISRDDYQQIVVSGQAGMGKSTELINIAVELRKSHRDHLVLCLDCKGAIKYANQGNIVHVICQMINATGGTKELLVRTIIHMGKLILLLDGLDEVSASRRKELEAMLMTISKTKLCKLFIATRPHCEDLIQRILPHRILCQLEPFSEPDQLEYLMSFWKVNEMADEKDRIRIEENAKGLISKFRSMLKDDSLIGIPLQTYMIAVIYKESIFLLDFEQPKPYKIGFVFKRFVELKFKESIKRQFDLANEAHENAINIQEQRFVPDHTKVAQTINANAPESELEQLCSPLQTYGVVHLHPSAGFVHHTYFEYFLSLYFLTRVTNANDEFVSYMKQNLCTSRMSIATKFMDFHIDEIDPSGKLQSDDGNTSCILNDFQPPTTARLHPDKIREFHYFLLNYCSESERYTLIRNSFNLSVFNVFEVLYDSMPLDNKFELKFRFGKNPEPNFVNLKLLGANQVLQLLSILHKKNSDDFVRRYLTDFSDDDEDFLEVACRKPFLQVLDWLVEELVPRVDHQEQNALNDYVDRRFDKYFRLVVQHNNRQFLQEAIQRAKNLWPKTTINRFLQEHNVLRVFLNTIEVPCDTKPLQVDQRVEMVHHIYNLYRWICDEQVLLSNDYINVIENLQFDLIRNAFNVTFQRL